MSSEDKRKTKTMEDPVRVFTKICILAAVPPQMADPKGENAVTLLITRGMCAGETTYLYLQLLIILKHENEYPPSHFLTCE